MLAVRLIGMASNRCKIAAHTDRSGGHKPSLGACSENGFFGQPLADHYVETGGGGATLRVIGSAYGRTAARGLNPEHAGLKGAPFRVPKAAPEGREFLPGEMDPGCEILVAMLSGGVERAQIWAKGPRGTQRTVWAVTDNQAAFLAKSLDGTWIEVAR